MAMCLSAIVSCAVPIALGAGNVQINPSPSQAHEVAAMEYELAGLVLQSRGGNPKASPLRIPKTHLLLSSVFFVFSGGPRGGEGRGLESS